MPCRRDSVGGGGLVADIFRDLKKPMRFSGGGGGGGGSRNFLWSPKTYAIQWAGGGRGSSAECFFSVTSKRHFPLMGPF